MQIRFENMSLGYAGGAAVLSDVDLTLDPGWTGIVGANGSGKSTLLAAVAGAPLVRGGRIVRVPDPMTVVTLDQRLSEPTEAVRDFAWNFDADAMRWRARLALGDDDVSRWGTLSPGQRRRWQVGSALHSRPHVLLLDEPGNHLDAEGLAALSEALREFDGIGLLVSHDRTLLDSLCTSVVRVAHGSARMFTGTYSQASERWQGEEAAAREEAERLRSAQRREARALVARRAELASAERQRSAGNRMSGVRDSDARGVAAQARADAGAAAAARQARRVANRLDATRQAREAHDVPGATSVDLKMQGERPRKAVIGELRDATLMVGEHVVLRDVSLAVPRDARWWIRGANGAGKSTLLRGLLGALTIPTERVLWLAQEEGDAFDARDALEELPPDERGEVLSRAGALGVDVKALLRSERWSPGEARKVALALAVHRQVWCMALDEPTNHLDLPSREALQAALASYDGALLLITHDEALGRGVTDAEVWVDEGGVELRVTSTASA